MPCFSQKNQNLFRCYLTPHHVKMIIKHTKDFFTITIISRLTTTILQIISSPGSVLFTLHSARSPLRFAHCFSRQSINQYPSPMTRNVRFPRFLSELDKRKKNLIRVICVTRPPRLSGSRWRAGPCSISSILHLVAVFQNYKPARRSLNWKTKGRPRKPIQREKPDHGA